MAQFTDLPAELHIRIFLLLGSSKNVLRLALVCRQTLYAFYCDHRRIRRTFFSPLERIPLEAKVALLANMPLTEAMALKRASPRYGRVWQNFNLSIGADRRHPWRVLRTLTVPLYATAHLRENFYNKEGFYFYEFRYIGIGGYGCEQALGQRLRLSYFNGCRDILDERLLNDMQRTYKRLDRPACERIRVIALNLYLCDMSCAWNLYSDYS